MTSNLEFDTMPKRKPLDEQGGSAQKAKRARAVAAEHGALDNVVLVQKKREGSWLLNTKDMQHWTVNQHGTGFKDGAGAK